METFKEIAFAVVVGIAMVFGVGLLFAGVEMWLWNQVVPELFGLKEITFWQALCLSWLTTMLFKGISPSTSKSESHLERIVNIANAQLRATERQEQAADTQVRALEEIKDSISELVRVTENKGL